MALTESLPFKLGSQAPNFELFDTASDKIISLKQLQGNKGTAIFFICNHCPFVLHINDELVKMAQEYQSKGIAFIAISSNDVNTHPQDGPDQMKIVANQLNYSFPYLYDETQDVAKAYKAACTPDIYLFDADLKAVYHGQLDDSRPGNNIPVTGTDMRLAMDALLNNQENIPHQKPSIGCNIKWK